MLKIQPAILCVDDEPQVLEAHKLNLRRLGRVLTESSGEAALRTLEHVSDVAVIISDLRMPGMDGMTFLTLARQKVPEAVRILLTGFADVKSAVDAVNDGGLFRFLTKPTRGEQLNRAVQDALAQHRLVTAERILLQKTLLGSMRALVHVFALSNPRALGRAIRVRDRVRRIAGDLQLSGIWQAEFAAIFSQMGAVTISQETLERAQRGEPLNAAERQAIGQNTHHVIQALANVPRLEGVTDLLTELDAESDRWRRDRSALARVLAAVIRVERLEWRGHSPEECVDALRAEYTEYGVEVVDAVAQILCEGRDNARVLFLAPAALEPGMTLIDDVRTRTGLLVAPRGVQTDDVSIPHIQNFQSDLASPTIRVFAPDIGAEALQSAQLD